ncbi:MAG: trypsin-like peptidase domain-containing protein, partial [Caldilineaceae bacterium]|nr:trypsin-like peptidase domain-containing protein [Caldilineaceae bacterium]
MEQQWRRRDIRLFLLIGSVFLLLLMGCALLIGLFVPLRSEITVGARRGESVVKQDAVPFRAVQVVATPKPLVVVATPEGGVDYESAVLINLYRQVNPSVVNITALSTGDALNEILPHQFEEDELFPLGSGSGFVWDRDGHIVTNHHVVEGVNQLQVTFSDGTMAVAEVVGSDVSSDLAVLRIAPEGYTLVPVQRGKMEGIQVGMRVAAIGNPFGMAGTLTTGIVSALGRSIPARTSFSIPDAIQT